MYLNLSSGVVAFSSPVPVCAGAAAHGVLPGSSALGGRPLAAMYVQGMRYQIQLYGDACGSIQC
jgi:hypothetical protein